MPEDGGEREVRDEQRVAGSDRHSLRLDQPVRCVERGGQPAGGQRVDAAVAVVDDEDRAGRVDRQRVCGTQAAGAIGQHDAASLGAHERDRRRLVERQV